MTSRARKCGHARRTVIENVKRLRAQERITYAELSARLNKLDAPIPILGIRRLEQGTRAIDVDELVALADAFHVPVTVLLDESAPAVYRKLCLQWLLAEAEHQSSNG